jgi:cytochrome c oxidase subunit 1
MAATTEQALTPLPQIVARRVEPERTGWTSWVTTTDHKRIGIMYLVLTFVFFILGGTEALLMRLQLSQANNTLLDPQTYNELFTMHGTTMIFLFVVPIMAGLRQLLRAVDDRRARHGVPEAQRVVFWLLRPAAPVFYARCSSARPSAADVLLARCRDSEYLPSGGVDAWIFLIHLTASSLVGRDQLLRRRSPPCARPGMGWGPPAAVRVGRS